MLSRRRFLAWAALAALGAVPLASRLLSSAGGSGSFATPSVPPIDWQIAGAAATDASLASLFASLPITVTVGGVTVEEGFIPAASYPALWTRDHAYVLWHHPELMTATQRRQFVAHRIATRSSSPADFIADRIAADGTVTYKNPGTSALPFMDGIAFTVLALWADWTLTADTTTFDDNEAAILDCLAAIPRSVNGCVYSDPADPSVDYGFTDTVLKTGDVAYGTALQAWAYKMCADISGDSAYSTLRAEAEAGLATLRRANGFYKGSSGNNATVDDVWATALIVAEELVSGADRIASAQAIADAYADGSTGPYGYSSTITQYGLVRHLPVGQSWTGTSTTAGTYQNGGYWLTPLWDCVRAVALVDQALALTWATEAMQQIEDEHTAEGDWHDVPYEWHNYGVGVGAKGYTASAAVVHRFV